MILLDGPRYSRGLVMWAEQRLPLLHGQGFAASAQAIGVASEAGDIMGAIVFHDWQPAYRTLQVSAVSVDPRWMRARGCFARMWRYGFIECGARKLWSATPAKNARALKFVKGLGFHEEARLKEHFGDDDAVICARFRDEWARQFAERKAA